MPHREELEESWAGFWASCGAMSCLPVMSTPPLLVICATGDGSSLLMPICPSFLHVEWQRDFALH